MNKVIVPQALYDHVKELAEAAGPQQEQAKLWLDVIAPNVMLPVELTLKEFGWAPGGYMFVCIDCPKDLPFADQPIGDKRAWRCEKHAQQRLDEAKRKSAPAAGAPKTTVDGE